MKNYFKKFSIMFVMLLAVIGFGIISNGSVANAATVGQALTDEEDGWQRYDDTDSSIIYNGSWSTYPSNDYYNGNMHYTTDYNSYVKLEFYGRGFRYLATIADNNQQSQRLVITIDGVVYPEINTRNSPTVCQAIIFQALDLEKTNHVVKINRLDAGTYLAVDAIDVYTGVDESILLDKSSINLNVGNSEQLTATTTPAGVGVTWASSDSSIATADSNGKVTGINEGTCTITATTADGLIATCTVTVTPKGTYPKPPVEPTNPTDANLFIELVDGNIKQYKVSQDKINDFIEWYKDRDKDDNESPFFKFTKGDYTDYVIHDQIDWFEVR